MRDSIVLALQYWKGFLGSDSPEPSGIGSSIKESYNGARGDSEIFSLGNYKSKDVKSYTYVTGLARKKVPFSEKARGDLSKLSAHLLTNGGAYKNTSTNSHTSYRTDRSGLIVSSPWDRKSRSPTPRQHQRDKSRSLSPSSTEHKIAKKEQEAKAISNNLGGDLPYQLPPNLQRLSTWTSWMELTGRKQERNSD